MARRIIPVDTALVDESDLTDEDYSETVASQQELRERVLSTPAARARFDAALHEMHQHQASLARVRKARALAQATVAELAGMTQSEVSKLERRSDMFVSTLRRFVEATGGELHVVACYPEGSVELLVPFGHVEVEGNESLPVDAAS